MNSRSLAATLALVLTIALPAGCSAQGAPQNLGAAILENLSAQERSSLADKYITPAEYASANAATLSCLQQQGFTVTTDPSNVLTGVALETRSGSSDGLETGQQCLNETDAIGAVWILQTQLSESEKAQARGTFVDCVRLQGLDVSGSDPYRTAVLSARTALSNATVRDTGNSPNADTLQSCLDVVAKAEATALPGLADALAHMDLVR